MSLRSEIRALYAQGLPDPAVRARMDGRGTPEAIRSLMSKERIARGMVLRPDLCGPRSKRVVGAALQPLCIGISSASLDRLDQEADACGLSRSAFARRIIEAALASNRVSA